MITRKQMFEETTKMKVHYLELSGVTFINFPADVSIVDGEIGYDGGMLEVAHQIAEQIPESIRSSVTVDFDKVPAWKMREKNLEKSFGGPLPEEHILGEASKKLLELIGATE